MLRLTIASIAATLAFGDCELCPGNSDGKVPAALTNFTLAYECQTTSGESWGTGNQNILTEQECTDACPTCSWVPLSCGYFQTVIDQFGSFFDNETCAELQSFTFCCGDFAYDATKCNVCSTDVRVTNPDTVAFYECNDADHNEINATTAGGVFLTSAACESAGGEYFAPVTCGKAELFAGSVSSDSNECTNELEPAIAVIPCTCAGGGNDGGNDSGDDNDGGEDALDGDSDSANFLVPAFTFAVMALRSFF